MTNGCQQRFVSDYSAGTGIEPVPTILHGLRASLLPPAARGSDVRVSHSIRTRLQDIAASLVINTAPNNEIVPYPLFQQPPSTSWRCSNRKSAFTLTATSPPSARALSTAEFKTAPLTPFPPKILPFLMDSWTRTRKPRRRGHSILESSEERSSSLSHT